MRRKNNNTFHAWFENQALMQKHCMRFQMPSNKWSKKTLVCLLYILCKALHTWHVEYFFWEYYNISRRLLEISILHFNHCHRMYHFYRHLTHYHLTFFFCLFCFHYLQYCFLLFLTLLLIGRATLFRLHPIVYLIVFLAFDMGIQEDKYTQLLTEY